MLAALREVYDGRWERNVGTDGGRTLTWTGRIVVIGAVTTAWDRAHAVIAAMGDRFVLRPHGLHRRAGTPPAARRISNTGGEDEMRARARRGRRRRASPACRPASRHRSTDDETERLLAAADVVTLARTAVELDYRGDVIDAHAPEMPTRFAKQLAQVVRGASRASAWTATEALRLALRCARDSMPPLRLAILDDLAAHPGTRPRPTCGSGWTSREPPSTASCRRCTCSACSTVAAAEDAQQRTVWRY